MKPARLPEEDGQVAAFVVVLVVGLLLFAGLVLDGGRALAAKVSAIGQAQEAARAGAQEIDMLAYRTDGTLGLAADRASAAARSYLASAGCSGTVSTVGNAVEVTVTVNQPTQLLGVLGIGSITVTGTGRARPRQGDQDDHE